MMDDCFVEVGEDVSCPKDLSSSVMLGIQKQSIDWRRKLQGFRLILATLTFVLWAPLACLGGLFKLIGYLLIAPARSLGIWFIPQFVKLWYIHRIGKYHATVTSRMRKRNGMRPHSRTLRIDLQAKNQIMYAVHTIAQLNDNYAYLVVNREARYINGGASKTYEAFIVDCSDALAAYEAIESIRRIHYRDGELVLQAILTTHHHWDHMGGNIELRELCADISAVYGGEYDRVLGCTHKLSDGTRFTVSGLDIQAIHMPCHTRGSITYKIIGDGSTGDAYFLGDTLFMGGCGACFEGRPEDMDKNFTKLFLMAKPNDLLFPGHEYSERILATLFPTRAGQLAAEDPRRYQALVAMYGRVCHLRALAYPAPTIPTPLGEEMQYNPSFDPILSAAKVVCVAAESALRLAILTEPSPQNNFTGLERVKPSLALDDGTNRPVVIEPPWILDGSKVPAPPWTCDWNSFYELNGKSKDDFPRAPYFDKSSRSTNISPPKQDLLKHEISYPEVEGVKSHTLPTTIKGIANCMILLCEPNTEQPLVRFSTLEHILTVSDAGLRTLTRTEYNTFLDLLIKFICGRKGDDETIQLDRLIAFTAKLLRHRLKTESIARHGSAGLFEEPTSRRRQTIISKSIIQRLPQIQRLEGSTVISLEDPTSTDPNSPPPPPLTLHDFTRCRICQGRPICVALTTTPANGDEFETISSRTTPRQSSATRHVGFRTNLTVEITHRDSYIVSVSGDADAPVTTARFSDSKQASVRDYKVDRGGAYNVGR